MITNLTFTNRLSKTALISLGLAAASLAFAPGQAKADTRTFNIAPSGTDPGMSVLLEDTGTTGEVKVTVSVVEGSNGSIADINGVYFDLPDGVGSVTASSVSGGPVNTLESDLDGDAGDLGDGVNMKGQGQSSFDVGIRIGNSGGINDGDDYQNTVFTLSGTGLSLESFTEQGFGVRLKSVGAGNKRDGSLKLGTTITSPIVATNPPVVTPETPETEDPGTPDTPVTPPGGGDPVEVPEPLTMGGLILGAGGLIAARRRKMSQKG